MIGRKKTISIILLIASVGIFAGGLFFLNRSARFSQLVVTASEYAWILSEHTDSEDDLIDGIVFGDEELFFDPASDTFYYSLPEGAADALDPQVRIRSEYRNMSVAVLEKGITQNGIEQNETIELVAYDDSISKKYHLKCTTLPLLNISTAASGEIPADAVPMELTLFDNRRGAPNRVTYSDGYIHVRGGTTRAYPKLGYRISLTQMSLGENERPNHIALLGLREDDDWILYAAYNDQEKIRNVFSSNLWEYTCAADNEKKVNTGMEYKYLELFLNNRYWGLYAIGYPIDEKQLNFSADSYDTALFKKVSWDAESDFDPEGSTMAGYRLASAVDQSDAELISRKWALLIDYYKNLAANAQNNEALYQGIDIDNVIDAYLFINLIQGSDTADNGAIKNVYFAIEKDREQIRALYCPWDMDMSWGNCWTHGAHNSTSPYGLPVTYNCYLGSGYFGQLCSNNDPEIWNLVYEKYEELRSTVWSDEYISQMLDEYEADIFSSGAYLRDMERWPEGTYANNAQGLDVFRKFVADRFAVMDSYYSNAASSAQ